MLLFHREALDNFICGVHLSILCMGQALDHCICKTWIPRVSGRIPFHFSKTYVCQLKIAEYKIHCLYVVFHLKRDCIVKSCGKKEDYTSFPAAMLRLNEALAWMPNDPADNEIHASSFDTLTLCLFVDNSYLSQMNNSRGNRFRLEISLINFD